MAANLYQKLLNITEEIGKIDKTGTNSGQGGYKFIEQSLLVAEVRVQLAKHKVMIIPETVDRDVERFEVTNKDGSKGTRIHANVTSRYTLVNAEEPTDRLVCDWNAGEALDTSDKATNKAITASHKYFLMKLFNISDKDDPDSESPSSDGTSPRAATAARIQPKQLKDISDVLTAAGVAKEDQMKTLANLTMKADLNVREISFLEGAKILDDLMAATPETIKNLSKSEPF